MALNKQNRAGGHVVAESGTMSMRCTHCGASVVPNLPMSVTDWMRAANRFIADHVNCKPKSGLGGSPTSSNQA